MKIRLQDRILMLLLGLLLLAAAGTLLAETVFGGIMAGIGSVMTGTTPAAWAVKAAVIAVLLFLAVLCFCFVFRRNRHPDFILLKTENGELSISVKTIDTLVRKCVKTHDEIMLHDIDIASARDGMTITLRVAMGSEISIPLAVGAIQKQMKQYIVSSTGADVKEVCVVVENSDDTIDSEAYKLNGLLKQTEEEPKVEIPAAETEPAASQPEEPAEREEFLHQRLLQHDEPALYPQPESAEQTPVEPEKAENSEAAASAADGKTEASAGEPDSTEKASEANLKAEINPDEQQADQAEDERTEELRL